MSWDEAANQKVGGWSPYTQGECWDEAPKVTGEHVPLPERCELPHGHGGAHKRGLTQWMRLSDIDYAPAITVTDDIVERACEAFGGLIAPKWEHAGEWEREHVRASMRAALVAALQPAHESDGRES